MQTTASSTSIDLFSGLLDQLSRSPVVLAIVTATQGHVASQVGDKLLIWGDAQSFGSLNDATVTTAVMGQSFAVLKTGIAQRLVVATSAGPIQQTAPAVDTPQVQVWLTRWQGSDAIATAQATLSTLKTSQPGRLVVPLVTGQFPYISGRDSPSLRNLQGQDAYIEDL
ncbi:MAG: XdhC family protein [Cyanobacteria bacterium P01_A01_bin.15]